MNHWPFVGLPLLLWYHCRSEPSVSVSTCYSNAPTNKVKAHLNGLCVLRLLLGAQVLLEACLSAFQYASYISFSGITGPVRKCTGDMYTAQCARYLLITSILGSITLLGFHSCYPIEVYRIHCLYHPPVSCVVSCKAVQLLQKGGTNWGGAPRVSG